MKRILLSLGLLLALTGGAFAQCVGVGGINNAPPPGINCQTEPVVTTYVAVGVGIVPASTATDLACITGSSSKVIRVKKVRVSGSAGTAITVPVRLMKHTVANSGGSAATGSALPVPTAIDSNNAAATATTTAYTANPTIDTSATQLDAQNLGLGVTTAAAGGGSLFEWAGQRYAQSPVLRGTAQQVCVNINGTSPSSGLVNVTFEWTEAAQ